MSIWEMDLQTNMARWSDQTARLFGLPARAFEASREEFLSKVHPDDRADFTRRFRRAVEEGEDYEAEFRVIWPDGSEHWLHVLGRALRGASGEAQRLSGVARDITARKGAEQTLRQTEERYRSIVETAEEGIWLVDREWRITFVNRRLTQMFGHPAEEMEGRHITEYMDEEERRAAPGHMRLREQGQRSTQTAWGSASCIPTPAPGGAVVS